MRVDLLKEKYDWRQLRRWSEINTHIEIAGEHKRSLEREVERTSELLMAYASRIGARDTTKADELRVLHWSKLVPSVYPGILSSIAKLNGLLDDALKSDLTRA